MAHILIFDIGKTNKKCFVFDEEYRIVFEKTAQLPESTDEDGYPCEDLNLLKNWVLDSFRDVLSDARFQIRAANCTAYGASFANLDAAGNPLTPLYNYLKPFPETLQKQFFDAYGSPEKIALETASPVLGNLNSGLQLYWLKHQRPMIFKQIKWSLHLPQYISHLINGLLGEEATADRPVAEITSIGCHTMLWDFQNNDYHDWVKSEGIDKKFPPIHPSNHPIRPSAHQPVIGIGLHDSSAALIPYLACFEEPFVLISTGTWCISLNPFNHAPLQAEELAQDCLCYLSYERNPVKAARYFGGHEHDLAVKEMAARLGVGEDFYKSLGYSENTAPLSGNLNRSEIYTDYMRQLVEKQVDSTRLALGASSVRRIFVDGGFSKNEFYMTLLARALPEMEVFAAEVAQATALGAALAIHPFWNERSLPQRLISLKRYGL